MCNRQSDSAVDAAAACCGGDTQKRNDEQDGAHWLDGPDLLAQPLPADLQSSLGRFFGRDAVETLSEWATEIRKHTGGGSIDIDELCHTDTEADHWGDVDGERHYFLCFYDAVILAALEDKPVDVHTVSPEGTVVEARAVGSEELSVTPETAVFSLGIAVDAQVQSGEDPTIQDSYAAICPYVRAFPDRSAYETWANEVPAATVATPLSGATAFARALTDETTETNDRARNR